MTAEEGLDFLHKHGYGLHPVRLLPSGGPYLVSVVKAADDVTVAELAAQPTWDEAVSSAVAWCKANPAPTSKE